MMVIMLLGVLIFIRNLRLNPPYKCNVFVGHAGTKKDAAHITELISLGAIAMFPNKRRKQYRAEDKHQIAYFNWLSLAYPLVAPVTIHVPNEGIRNHIHGAKMGIRAGVPDIIMFVPSYKDGIVYHGLAIELKRPIVKGKPKPVVSAEQSIMISRLRANDYKCYICYNWLEAKEVTEDYLN